MRFIDYSHREYSYLSFIVTGGNQHDSIGDQVWISPDGNTMLVSETLSKSLVRDVMELFESSACAANFIESFMENK